MPFTTVRMIGMLAASAVSPFPECFSRPNVIFTWISAVLFLSETTKGMVKRPMQVVAPSFESRKTSPCSIALASCWEIAQLKAPWKAHSQQEERNHARTRFSDRAQWIHRLGDVAGVLAGRERGHWVRHGVFPRMHEVIYRQKTWRLPRSRSLGRPQQ